MATSPDFYDQLAPFYQEFSLRKKSYISAVDEIVLRGLRRNRMLDVGSGDGVRARRIAENGGIDFLVLAEPSEEMFKLCQRVDASYHLNLRAEELDQLPYEFDTITCLWNVLGHIKSQDGRVKALTNMSNLLSEHGILYLDVNNRYNIRAYGPRIVAKNILKDVLSPHESNEDVRYKIIVGGQEIAATGHVFSPPEIAALIKKAGLKIRKRHIIDYATGQERRTPLEGQLLFELSR